MLRLLRQIGFWLARPFIAPAINHSLAKGEAEQIINLVWDCDSDRDFEVVTDLIDTHYTRYRDRGLLHAMCKAVADRQLVLEQECRGDYPILGQDIAWESEVQ